MFSRLSSLQIVLGTVSRRLCARLRTSVQESNMNFGEEDQLYLHHHQKLLFHEKLESGTPAERAEITRNILSHLHIAYRNDKISEESYILLQQRFMSQYSSYVDTFDTETGLNNYADGALAICSLYRNDSQKWKSSLTSEHCKKRDWFKKILEKSHKTSSLLPPDKQNTVLIRSGNVSGTSNQALTKQNGAEENSLRDFNPSSRIQSILKSDRPVQSHNTNNTEEYKGYPEIKSTEICPSFSSHDGGHREEFRRKPLFASSGSVHMEYTAPNFDNNSISHGPQQRQPSLYRKNEVGGMKRPFREIDPGQLEEQKDVHSNNPGPFRTAREQLSIDNQKKYNKGRGQVSTMSYGTAKKSLGTRRGPSSKFVPPVMNRDEDDSNPGVCMNAVSKSIFNKGGSSSSIGGPVAGDEPVDERLKGIEPKMIELIMNEIMDHGPQMSWDDIAGLEFAKKTIKEIVVWPMLRPDIFTGLRGPPKGLLLFGPPGTGKTLIGKCIASQSKSTFFSISASSLTSKWVGEGEKMVRAMFAVARCYQPAVVFIDEIDSLLSQRSDGEHEASRRIKTEFLVQLDGAATVSEDRILVIGATNRPQEIDEAARRRFVKRLYIPLPEGPARRQIVVNLLAQQKYQLTESQLDVIEKQSDGYSGADVANLCREAALGPIRSMAFGEIENISADQVRPILFEDFDAAFMQVRASVSDKDLDLYIQWNSTYGSVPVINKC